jgi:hypothetical protein
MLQVMDAHLAETCFREAVRKDSLPRVTLIQGSSCLCAEDPLWERLPCVA